jgi:endonuclease/exonuclease/phosphatase family metal-dependent hydrolase
MIQMIQVDMRFLPFFLKLVAVLCLFTIPSFAASAQKSPAFHAKHKIAKSADVRILDDNIWDYSLDTIPAKWKEIGEDPRDFVRAPQFARLITDYMPDVLTLQEYSSHMHDELYPRIAKEGYVIAWESGEDWNNTPVFYYEKTMEPLYVKYHKYTPEQWCNRGTKSFTSIVLKRKSDGGVFSVINTHLWWKSDSVQPGSTMARASQLRLIMAEAEIIRAKFGNIPVFVVGDMNCEENTVPLQQLIQSGYAPCYKIATEYGDDHNGHHICAPNDGYSKKSRRKGPDRETGAIDHCLLLDTEGKTQVIVFDCIMEEYTVKLTDHYPLLVDFKL